MTVRVIFVISNPFALNAFLRMPIEALTAAGWRASVATNALDGTVDPAVTAHADIRHIELSRNIAPLRDLMALWQLWQLFRRERPDVVHSLTPKAGLLGMTAAWLAGVPCRRHTFTGQVWATRTGFMRWLLRNVDRFFGSRATEVLADSLSQRDFIAAEKVVPAGRVRVLGRGSICGVDTERFRPDPVARAEVRLQLGIPADAPLLLYVGRLHPEKGLAELGTAFDTIWRRWPAAHLVLAGPEEGGLASLRQALGASQENLHAVGLTREPERYMAAADIFCLPSYREGFGLSLLEAGAAGAPCVATRIYGVTDAVEDGFTGLLVPPHDAAALGQAIAQLLADPELAGRLGRSARERAIRDFSREVVLGHWIRLYAGER